MRQRHPTSMIIIEANVYKLISMATPIYNYSGDNDIHSFIVQTLRLSVSYNAIHDNAVN